MVLDGLVSLLMLSAPGKVVSLTEGELVPADWPHPLHPALLERGLEIEGWRQRGISHPFGAQCAACVLLPSKYDALNLDNDLFSLLLRKASFLERGFVSLVRPAQLSSMYVKGDFK
ncbi:uncharacterized protein ACIB01_003356 [Guaruba guarouba]